MRKHRRFTRMFGALALSLALATTSIPALDINSNQVYGTEKVETPCEVAKLENMFTTIDLMDATISELTQAMEKGQVTSKELVEMYIDRINAYDKQLELNSIISINPDAVAQAEELDKERAKGNIKGKLHGIPIIVKDNYDVGGLPTTAGCKALMNSIAPDDAFVVKKLKDAGAIILAKANMSEFASSGRNSRSTIGGAVHNPYDTTRTPAGSSGGTGVAITSNFAAAGLGTDTGSSVRAPSTMNNLFGLRVSLGLTSRDGIVPLSLDNDIAGPLCRSAQDLALVLSVMAGTDSNDSWTKDSDSMIPADGYASYLKADGLKGKKIGYLQNSFGYYYNNKGEAVENPKETATCMKKIVERAKSNLKKGGAELVDMSEILPDSLITSLRSNTGVGNVFEWDLNNYFASLGENAPIKSVYDLVTNYTYGVDYTNVYVRNPATSLAETTNPRSLESYTNAVTNRLKFRNEVNKILKDNGIDAVMFVPYTQPANKEADSQNASYANSANYTSHFGPTAGLPEMAIPMGLCDTDETLGYDKEMPMGFNLFTSYGNEKELIEIAYGYQETSGYDNIRTAPYTTPALEDKDLDKYLDNLMEKVDTINYDNYTVYPQGKIQVMINKYAKAADVDESDVYATYSAAYDLAKAYDKVMDVLDENVKTVKVVKAPGKGKITKITRAKNNKSVKLSLKKLSGAKGYEVKYSTGTKFSKKTTKTIYTAKTTFNIKNLKKNKKYYVKVRAYVKNGTSKKYGAWSAVKRIKIKK